MTASFSDALSSADHWVAVFVTLALTLATVGLHYEVLERLNFSMPRWRRVPPRLRILSLMVILIGLHVAEIWIFGTGLFWAQHNFALGTISGTDRLQLLDAVYLSATTYSTLGYGDLVPQGPIQFLLGTEALVGLLMITWSASFTYLEMQRYWRTR